jgi:hypothetical protein
MNITALDTLFITYYPLVLAVALIIILPVFIRVDKKNRFMPATALKTALSAICAFSAVLGFYGIYFMTYGAFDEALPYLLVAAGMLACIPGDILTRYISESPRKFNVGIICLCLMMCGIGASLILRYGIGYMEFIVMVIIVFLLLFMRQSQKWKFAKSAIPLFALILLLSFVTGKAVVSVIYDLDLYTICMAAGMVFFLIANVLYAIYQYRSHKRAYVVLNWVLRYAGMFFIAFSSYPYGFLKLPFHYIFM